ncbi:MAG TPA: translation initiation factor IF-2 [Nanoarchaeota archaeon]|nr:translation initiation factor IF-2 [Candidatus Woesearchaeota archaeon]HIH15351.1 translation initiation factor IF-2 [Nanoarchaeota archaeon]HIH59241.1 translation initiation factor IF-2 [Nanoarchaeota archaeon]HII13444.1 translation initiation factor IF-2 [Nanoarchaeota archaeon]HIJ05533.1 translation initiation factor IF-2 [Nanoarchaeota archaeon]
MLRQPLVVVMGNVDHGKTKILDCIRRTAVVESEPGAITQMISSSAISVKTIQKICGDLLKNKNISIPGFVFIDTPGHAAFSNMRKRGGNLADIAVLVIDINEGIKPQTEECISILKKYKTPFVIALNKVDLVSSFRSAKSSFVLQAIAEQSPQVQTAIETKLYEIVGKCYELGFQADRFDRIDDYTKTVAMIPCSAKTGMGIPEVLMVLIGLAQKYLEENLKSNQDAPAKATVLEVKEEQGLGVTLDAIVYEGKIKVNDPIIIGGLNEPIVTKVRALFLPDEKGKFISVKEVHAAAGVKISAVDIKEVVSGMPLFVIDKNESELREKIQEEVDEVVIETENQGIIVKADTLGSLEALISMLKEKHIAIKKATVGNVTKKDIAAAASSEDPYERVILCFNVKGEGEAVKIISHNVIYQLIDDFEAWIAAEKKKEEQKELLGLIRPAKIKYLRGCTFRQNNPCVIGVEILQGTLRPDTDLIKENGDLLGHIKTVEYERESIAVAEKGKQVAISLPGVTAGRQIHEEEIYYVDMNEENFRRLKEFKKLLLPEEIHVLKELAEIKRKANNFWGV